MWSGMLPELLNMIARRCMFYEDYFSFAGVCKSWRSAIVHDDYTNGRPSRFPSVLLAEEKKDGWEFGELFLLSNKSIRKIRLPEAYGKVCRSSCGWLITVGCDHATQLLNPLSRETINLPKINTFPEFMVNSRWNESINKLLIVTNDSSSLKLPLVVVLWGIFDEMGFCRPGDNKWTTVGCSNLTCDITYYNKKVYTFDKDYRIRACDVHGDDPRTLVDVSSLSANLHDHDDHHNMQGLTWGAAYIVGLDEGHKKRLLVVIKHGIEDECLWLETKRFILFAYDLEDGSWSRVNDFGRKTLFVGHSSTFWVEDATGVIKSNCIYFTDDVDFSYYRYKRGRDMGIYHLSDGTIEPHFTGKLCNILTPPMWLESY